MLTIDNLDRNLFANLLNERNSFKLVYDRSFGYNKLATVASILNMNKEAVRIATVDGKYEYAWDKKNEVIAQILTSTLNGTGTLTLTFFDPNYEFFRVKDYVMDTETVKGRVVQAGPGTVTIEPLTGAFSSGTHFAANMFCKTIGDLSGLRDSVGKTSLYTTPRLDYNYCQVSRDSVKISRKDRIATYTMYGEEYWWGAQEDEMIRRIATADERTLLHGERFQITSSVEGVVNGNGGLDWSIKNRGGLWKPLTSALTETQFQDILLEYQVRKANQTSATFLVMGSAMLHHIQRNFTADFIKYSGTTNTFGGTTVKGLNVDMYAIGGRLYNFLILPCLDDKDFHPETSTIPGVKGTRFSNRMYLLDLEDLPVMGPGGQKLPAIQRLYWGEGDKLYRCIPGMVGSQGNSTGGNMSGNYQLTASPVDAVQCEVLQDQGWNIPAADHMGLVEYIL